MDITVCSGRLFGVAQLTEKQEAFCTNIAAGRSKSQAYRESYDARGMSEQSIWCEAHRLSVHPKVAPRLAEIQSECNERLVSSAIADREEVLVAATDIERLLLAQESEMLTEEIKQQKPAVNLPQC